MDKLCSNKKYYIIRNGEFAINANTKIVYSVFSLCLCVEEYASTGSTVCFILFSGSTIIWTTVETILYLTGTRVIKPMTFNYNNGGQIELPRYVSLLLQGAQEGGCITTIGIYFGDRLFSVTHLIIFHALIIFIMVNIFNKTTSSTMNSRRQVNTAGSLLAMSGICIFNIHTMYSNPEHIYRQICMLAVMIYLSTWWTLAVWYRGFREVAVDDNVYSDIIVKKASRHDTAMVLAYDVIFEIGIAYLSFYGLLMPYSGSSATPTSLSGSTSLN
jgi:hypothetical protein